MGTPKLLEQTRALLRLKHYSLRTEHAYLSWIKRFIVYHQMRHPAEMGEREVRDFLSHLATDRHVAASTQNQALSALLFLYRDVLDQPLDWIDAIERAKKPSRLPVVFTRQEVQSILLHLEGVRWLIASLLYGSGLRLMECLRLRVKDIDFGYRQILVRDGKGAKIVFTQMTKARLFAVWAGGDDVPDLDIAVRDQDSVDQQFDQLALLLECRRV